MIHTRRSFLTAAAVASAASSLSLKQVAAATYPEGEVTIIVGFPTGGPLDIAARITAKSLSSFLGSKVSVINKPGASGNLATAEVVHAKPDGRTLLLCGPVHVINTSLFKDLPFDFERDIEPVAGLARVPLVIEVPPSLGIRSLPELIQTAKRGPGTLRAAYAGNGTPQHIAIELFKYLAEVDLTRAPYLGSAPALEDLLKARVQIMFDPIPSSLEYIRSERLIPLATTGTERAAVLPDVPSASEYVQGFEGGSWFGFGAPRGTPYPVVRAMNEAIQTALTSSDGKAQFAALGGTMMLGSPADFASFIARENVKYREIIQRAKIRI